MRVPLFDLAAQEAQVADAVLADIASIVREANFILGPRVEAFEKWLAEACGSTHGVGVASGTDALELTLRALGVVAGDAVVTPALSFIAAAEAITRAGARPVFCDVDPVTMNASVESVRVAIDRATHAGLRVQGVVPVHLFGRCAPSSLAAVAEDHGCFLVEDAAQALGARDENGKSAGASGDAGCFSFFPTKNLGAWGDAGAVVTSREDVAMRVRRLRVHGAKAPYVYGEVGHNSRLDALQAAVLLAKTQRIAGWQRERASRAALYRAELARLPVVLPDEPPPPAIHSWHAFVLRSDRRDALAKWLLSRDIDARVYYPVPLHRQACFAALDEPALPATEQVCRTALALPLFATLSDAQQGYVIDQVKAFFSS